MNRLVGTALVSFPLLLGGCTALEGLFPAAGKGEPQRLSGMWQKTVIGVQKYKNALFRDKQTGKVLDPQDAGDKPESEVTLEAGDFEELTYRAGRLRYALYARSTAAQPFVVERAVEEKEFEELDKALYADRFFGMPEKNWATERFPMYYVQYDQLGKGWKASFTPNLNRLLKFGGLVTTHFSLMSGQGKLPAGVKQHAYYMTAEGGKLKVSVSTLVGAAGGESEDRPWKVTGAQYDTGKGFQPATVEAGGGAFTLPQPAGDGGFQLMGLKITAEGDPGTWETLIPVRSSK